jgi:hypothetical protein
MSLVSLYENRVKQKQKDLERHRRRQADQESIVDKESAAAEKADAAARKATSSSTQRSKHADAERHRKRAATARSEAAKASAGVAKATSELNDAQRKLEAERAKRDKKAERDADRQRQREETERRWEDERRRRDDQRREEEIAALERRVAQQEDRLRQTAPSKVTVLVISSSPDDEDYLHIDREMREMKKRLREADHRDSIEFDWRPATRLSDLVQLLNEVRPDVIHFSGHSTEEGIVLEDVDGNAQLMHAGQIAALLSTMSKNIRLAVFNSCESATHADAACNFLEAAIGMETPIHDDVAMVFAGQFYNSLAFGSSVEEAFNEALLQVEFEGLDPESGRPRLYTASGVNAQDMFLVASS